MEFVVNEERCTQCGLCAADCPLHVIVQEEAAYPYVGDEEKCIKCQHCLAICPTAALSVFGLDPDESTPLKGAFPSQEQMETLIKGRRSIRSFKDEDVAPDTLRRLMETVWHAPTGTNAQQVLLTVVGKRAHTDALRNELYIRLAKARAERDISDRPEMNFLGWAAKVHEENGQDVIFRGAPHILVASAPKVGPCPVQDTHIALSYFDLLAPTMGLGALWNGMLTWAIRDIYPDLAVKMGIPEGHQIGYALVFGVPKVKYARTVQRTPGKIHYSEF